MKNALISRKLVKAVLAFVLLVYFMMDTTSPKIIFVPFLLCAFASAGKNLFLLLEQKRLALFFDRMFKVAFFLFWFGFLAVACYMLIKEKNYSLLLFTLPFWVVGFLFAKGRFRRKKDENFEEHN